MDICECRVAFVTENVIEFCEELFYLTSNMVFKNPPKFNILSWTYSGLNVLTPEIWFFRYF